MNAARAYYCPMHPEVRTVRGGECPHCHMALVAEGTRFALLRHIVANPVHLAVMAGIMVLVMAMLMMMPR